MPKWVESHISTNDLSSTGQFLGVKLSGDRTIVLVSSDTDICYGILQNDPGAGEQAAVMKEGKCPIITAETLAAGNIVRIDSNGKAALHAGGGDGADKTKHLIGLCTIGAASGKTAEVEFNCTVPVKGDAVT